MSIKSHHQKMLETYYRKLGLSCLKEIQYQIANYCNTRQICKDYSLEMSDVRYLMTIDREVTTFVWEKEHRQQLTLVYSKPMAA